MNLETIDSALKNRFNSLTQRKLKELEVLEIHFE